MLPTPERIGVEYRIFHHLEENEMKPLFVSMLLAGMSTLWLSAPAHARPLNPGVNAQQYHQQQRIGQGVRSGDLTRGEARHLEGEQRRICLLYTSPSPRD